MSRDTLATGRIVGLPDTILGLTVPPPRFLVPEDALDEAKESQRKCEELEKFAADELQVKKMTELKTDIAQVLSPFLSAMCSRCSLHCLSRSPVLLLYWERVVLGTL